MKTIRKHCHETNSSSSHVLTIDNSYIGKNNPAGTFIPLGEFGWEWRKYNSFEDKASYLWTLCHDAENASEYFQENYPNEHQALVNLKKHMLEFEEEHDFILQRPVEGSWNYVDHGSEHFMVWLKKHPELNTKDGLWNFLVSKSHWIMTGNDNSVGPANSRLTPKQISEGKYILKFLSDEHVMPDDKPETIEEFARNAFYAFDDEKYNLPYGEWEYSDIESIKDGKIKVSYKKSEYVDGNHNWKKTRDAEFDYEVIVKH